MTSDCSSSSSSSECNFDQSDLLEIIAILLLPIGSTEDLDIVRSKDSDVIALIEELYAYFEFEDDDLKLGFAKIVNFINQNRKELSKRRINMNKFENDELATLISDGLNDIN